MVYIWNIKLQVMLQYNILLQSIHHHHIILNCSCFFFLSKHGSLFRFSRSRNKQGEGGRGEGRGENKIHVGLEETTAAWGKWLSQCVTSCIHHYHHHHHHHTYTVSAPPSIARNPYFHSVLIEVSLNSTCRIWQMTIYSCIRWKSILSFLSSTFDN